MNNHISTNIGSIKDLKFQKFNSRLKGSYPYIITSHHQIINHLKKEILKNKKNINKISRISSRYFVNEKVIKEINKIDKYKFLEFSFKIEVKIELGNILKKQNINDKIWWVWVGGNIAQRKTNPLILKNIFQKKQLNITKNLTLDFSSSHIFAILGTPSKLKKISRKELPSYIQKIEISDIYAQQIAKLYSQRMSVYITDNHNPKYIKETIAKNPKINLFAAINLKNQQIESIVANEFFSLPIKINKNTININFCESIDWIKKRGVNQKIFLSLLKISLINAIHHKPKIIEAECVPEAIKKALKTGFEYSQYPLERTSRIVTDGENIELKDTTIPKEFREFSSLMLMYIKENSKVWNNLKRLN